MGKCFSWKWKRSQKFVWELPDGICFWGQKWRLTSVRPIPSVIRKEKSLTWKHLSKIGRTKFSYGQPWNHGSDGNFFFVQIGFSPIKRPTRQTNCMTRMISRDYHLRYHCAYYIVYHRFLPKTYTKLFSIKGRCFCCCCFQCNFPYLIVRIRAWFAG
jgi:hypothetical protein